MKHLTILLLLLATFGHAQDPDSTIALAQARLDANNATWAIRTVQPVLAADSTNQQALLLAGEAYTRTYSFNNAKRCLDKLIAINDTTPMAYWLRAEVYSKLVKSTNAEKNINLALADLGNMVALGATSGKVYKRIGDYNVALADYYTRVINRPPGKRQNGWQDDTSIDADVSQWKADRLVCLERAKLAYESSLQLGDNQDVGFALERIKREQKRLSGIN